MDNKQNNNPNPTPKEFDENFALGSTPITGFFYNKAVKISWKPFGIKLVDVPEKDKFHPKSLNDRLKNQLSVKYVPYSVDKYLLIFFVIFMILLGLFVWSAIS